MEKGMNEIKFPLIAMKRDFEIQKEKVNVKGQDVAVT